MDFPASSQSSLFNYSLSRDPLEHQVFSPLVERRSQLQVTPNPQQHPVRETRQNFEYVRNAHSHISPYQPHQPAPSQFSDIRDNSIRAAQNPMVDSLPQSQNGMFMNRVGQNGHAPTGLADVINNAIENVDKSLAASLSRPLDGMLRMNGTNRSGRYRTTFNDVHNNIIAVPQSSLPTSEPRRVHGSLMDHAEQIGDIHPTHIHGNNNILAPAQNPLTGLQPRAVHGNFMGNTEQIGNIPTTFNDVNNNAFVAQQKNNFGLPTVFADLNNNDFAAQQSSLSSQARPINGTFISNAEHIGTIPATFNDVSNNVFDTPRDSSSAAQRRPFHSTFMDDAGQIDKNHSTFKDVNNNVFAAQPKRLSVSKPRAVDHTATENVWQSANAPKRPRMLPRNLVSTTTHRVLLSDQLNSQGRPSRKRDRLGRLVEATQSSFGFSQDDTDDSFPDLDVFSDHENDVTDDENHDTDAEYESLHSDADENGGLPENELDGMGEEVHCEVCNKKFGDEDSLKRHSARQHKAPPAEPSKFRCDNCNEVFVSANNLKRHINNVHTGTLDRKCKFCPATFTTDRSLAVHLGKQHMDKRPEEGGPKRQKRRKTNKIFECEFCDYKSDQKYNVTRHFKSQHTDQTQVFCPYGCGKVCKSKANMKTHMMSCRQRA